MNRYLDHFLSSIPYSLCFWWEDLWPGKFLAATHSLHTWQRTLIPSVDSNWNRFHLGWSFSHPQSMHRSEAGFSPGMHPPITNSSKSGSEDGSPQRILRIPVSEPQFSQMGSFLVTRLSHKYAKWASRPRGNFGHQKLKPHHANRAEENVKKRPELRLETRR